MALGLTSALKRRIIKAIFSTLVLSAGHSPSNAAEANSASLSRAPLELSALQKVLLAQQAEVQAAPTPLFEKKPASIASGTPNLFGSVAVAISTSPLDSKWKSISTQENLHPSAARLLTSSKDVNRDSLEQANRWVNERIKYRSDAKTSGRNDHWATANDTFESGFGDCEDYVVAKLRLLETIGFAKKDLYVSIVRDVVTQSDHALLIVRVDGELLALDNNSDVIINARERHGFRPVITYSADGKTWTHGYRVNRVRLASASAVGLPRYSR